MNDAPVAVAEAPVVVGSIVLSSNVAKHNLARRTPDSVAELGEGGGEQYHARGASEIIGEQGH